MLFTPSLVLIQLQTLMKRYKKKADDVKHIIYYDGRAKKNFINPQQDRKHYHSCSLDDFLDALMSLPEEERNRNYLAWDVEFKVIGTDWWIECDSHHEFKFCQQPSLEDITYKKGDFGSFFQPNAFIDNGEDD